jgi:uncharacterized membrane protein (UPF0127 family)
MGHLKSATAVFGILVVATLMAEAVYGQNESGPAWLFTRSLRVGGALFQVAVADSPEKRRHGLSGVRIMGSSEGLYFMYPTPRLLLLWMKDMQFPIDIVWIDRDHRVVHIRENVAPETFPTVFSSQQPAQYALEINAGAVGETGIAIGDIVTLR